MANNDKDNDTAITVGAIGGGALLLWWLLRHVGGGSGDGHGGDGAPTSASPPDESRPTEAAPCEVFLRGKVIELDGAASDLPTVIAACRASGKANLRVTGDTIQGHLVDFVRALNAAGVAIFAQGRLTTTVHDAVVSGR